MRDLPTRQYFAQAGAVGLQASYLETIAVWAAAANARCTTLYGMDTSNTLNGNALGSCPLKVTMSWPVVAPGPKPGMPRSAVGTAHRFIYRVVHGQQLVETADSESTTGR